MKPPSLKTGAALTFGQQLVQILLRLGFIVLIARYLGVSANGQIAIAILTITAVNKLLILGIDNSNVYHISHDLIKPATCVIMSAIVLPISCTFAFFIIFALVSNTDLAIFADVDNTILWLAFIFYPFFVLNAFTVSILRGMYEIYKYNITAITSRIATILVALTFILFENFTIRTAILSWGLGFLVAFLLGSYFVFHSVDFKKVQHDLKILNLRRWLFYGMRDYLGALSSFLTLKSDVFIVNYFLGSWSAGIYSVSLQICDRISLLPQSLATVLFPKLGKLRQSSTDRLRYVEVLASGTLYSAVTLAIMIIIFAHPVIVVFFGREFEPSIDVIWVLMPGIVAFSVTRILAVHIYTIGRPGLNSKISGAVFVTNVSLNLILIPKIGIIGAAFSTTVAYALSLILYILIVSNIENSKIILKILYNREFIVKASRMVLRRVRE